MIQELGMMLHVYHFLHLMNRLTWPKSMVLISCFSVQTPGHYVTSSSTSRRVKLYERDAIGGIAYSVGLGKWISGGNWSRRLCSIGCVRLRYVIPALMRKRTGWLSGIMWRGRFDRNTEHTIEKVLMVGKPVASYLSLVFMCLGGAVWHGARDSQRCNHYC